MDVPSSTIDLINLLKEKYPDELNTNPKIVGTPEYWKTVGVVQLLRELQFYIDSRST